MNVFEQLYLVVVLSQNVEVTACRSVQRRSPIDQTPQRRRHIITRRIVVASRNGAECMMSKLVVTCWQSQVAGNQVNRAVN